MKKRILSVLSLLIASAVIYLWQTYVEQPSVGASSNKQTTNQQQLNHNTLNNPQLLAAFNNRVAKLQVKGQGIIVKVLKDDLDGSRHQRLLLKVNDKQTVLVAHNIDLAPRIPNPKVGDVVTFYGEYVWNNQGGVIHWTHRDPRAKHADGWLRHNQKIYQ